MESKTKSKALMETQTRAKYESDRQWAEEEQEKKKLSTKGESAGLGTSGAMEAATLLGNAVPDVSDCTILWRSRAVGTICEQN